MKTKIIYISGSEIFNIADIRAAFEEVRSALQLSQDTVLFGVPVDSEDAGFGTNTEEPKLQETEIVEAPEAVPEPVVEAIEEIEPTETVVADEPEKSKQKRGRTKKNAATTPVDDEQISAQEKTEKIVPILSVLSTKEDDEPETETAIIKEEPEIIEDVVEAETPEQPAEIIETDTDIIPEIDTEPETENLGEPDLEELLSSMTPLQEDTLEDTKIVEEVQEITEDVQSDDVDATLEQLATEFAETQDKIAASTKSSARSKIGKLRNILPFKQSKQKDTGLGDLFGWAGVAANDEEFSVPGFFTNASSKK